MINAAKTTCLIVGLGAPKQEIWIVRHQHLMPDVKVYMGVGATIDYEAQAVRRAPRWMTQNGLEWVYRMATEPRRYWRRYTRTLEFFWLVLADRFGLYRVPAELGETFEATSEAKAV
jgi:exopolysaccharide biosynthesis WecB/TagA/CpsF family protein